MDGTAGEPRTREGAPRPAPDPPGPRRRGTTGNFVRRFLRHRGLHANGHEKTVERQADDEVHPGPNETGRAPAHRGVQIGGDRPADRTRKTRQQRDAGDSATCLSTVDAGEGGECRLVKPHRHAGADDEPSEKQEPRSLRHTEQGEAGGEDQAGKHQYIAPAEQVDAAAGNRSEDRGGNERDRERAEDQPGRHAEIARHQLRQDRRQVVGRAPGQRLRASERDDDAHLFRRAAHGAPHPQLTLMSNASNIDVNEQKNITRNTSRVPVHVPVHVRPLPRPPWWQGCSRSPRATPPPPFGTLRVPFA